MSKLIDELKQEHVYLVEKLTEVQKSGIVSEAARETFFACKNALLAHLGKEDRELYPTLKEEAAKDGAFSGTLVEFATEMTKISGAALAFFQKYEQNSNDPNFSNDIAVLLAGLGSRIRKEEMILYKRYDEIIESNAQ